MGLFGRSKRTTSGPICATCGRTLLAGELTQKLIDEDGTEQFICSLCGQPSMSTGEAHVVSGASLEGVERERSESDAFWRALKEKDAEIARLEARLARSEAERQELAGQFALVQAQLAGEAAQADLTDAPPAETLAAHEAFADPVETFDTVEPVDTQADALAPAAHEASRLDGVLVAGPAQLEAETAEAVIPDAAAVPRVDESHVGEDTASMPTPEDESPEATPDAADAGDDTIVPVAAEPDGGVSSLTLLQRGVDVLNVSPVPRKVADTSADLGVPHVHVGSDGYTVAVTFLWSLGWYRFSIDIDGSGTVRLDERGYDDRPDLQPNASVRPDGTVQLAPAQISKAARGREQAAPAEDDEAPAARTPRDAAERAPEIVSQSLLGQRTDDEPSSWEQTQAREFHW